ncbi:MAG: hypothetical protein OXC29_11265, partial [Rhodococcus sp.]|nr:hypothetical protein [Rhodococcus sp. (in: high G+C Gram-positive bacteria)]
VGTLVRAGEIEWHRHSNPAASMTFGFLKVRGISAQAAGVDRVIASDVIERHEDYFRFDKPVKYTRMLSHTFTKTASVEEATEQAWKVAAKASLSLAYGGVTGAVEASAEYGQKLARKTAESGTTSDTVTTTVELQGPVEVRWVAERSTDTLLRDWEAVPDLDFKLYWRTEDSGWEWASYADVFVAAARGEAPVDQSYSIFASSSPSHALFADAPVSADDIAALEAALARPIRFSAEYQVVNRASIEAL